MMIRNRRDMVRYLGARSQKQAELNVPNYSDCGASLSFTETGIVILAPTGDADFGISRYELSYPLASTTYEERMQAIESPLKNGAEDQAARRSASDEGMSIVNGPGLERVAATFVMRQQAYPK